MPVSPAEPDIDEVFEQMMSELDIHLERQRQDAMRTTRKGNTKAKAQKTARANATVRRNWKASRSHMDACGR